MQRLEASGMCGGDGGLFGPGGRSLGRRPGRAYPRVGARHFIPSAPGSTFYPAYVSGPYPPYASPAPVASFNWGYFGARQRPVYMSHVGYYGEPTQTIYPRGF